MSSFDTSEYEQAQTRLVRSLLEDFYRRVFADHLDPTVAHALVSKQAKESKHASDAAEEGPARPVRMNPDRQVNRPVEEQVVEWANAFPHFRSVGGWLAQTDASSFKILR